MSIFIVNLCHRIIKILYKYLHNQHLKFAYENFINFSRNIEFEFFLR